MYAAGEKPCNARLTLPGLLAVPKAQANSENLVKVVIPTFTTNAKARANPGFGFVLRMVGGMSSP